jgi:3-carboxy-cis,cis-muconate cycloisomerase
VVLTGGTLQNGQALAQNLAVDPERMAANLERAGGVILSEALSYALAEVMPRAAAHHLVAEAARDAVAEGRPLVEVVREQVSRDFPDATIDWQRLADPAKYLGAADTFIDRVLDHAHALGVGGAEEAS